MKTQARFGWFRFLKYSTALSALGLAASLLAPQTGLADGCFVVPPFVWDKYRDINEPTQKAILVHDAGREDLILQVKYDGPVEEFGWLIPTPSLPKVEKGSMECFYELSRYTQEHFERHLQGIPMGNKGDGEGVKTEPVKVIEVKVVGAYEVAVLSTQDATSLGDWLKANGFALPKGGTEVIDSYVKQEWFFIAVKINLGKGSGFQLVNGKGKRSSISPANVKSKLARGELHPLHITFDSTRCVFPLKISSLNHTPSEVQVYVLSREPLVEKALFEKQLPTLHRQRLETDAMRAQSERNLQALRAAVIVHEQTGMGGGRGEFDPPFEDDYRLSRESDFDSRELTPLGQVSAKVLPACAKSVPRIKSKTWWLTKKTWMFRPDEMRDLEFQPAIPVFTGLLSDAEGDFVAANLALLGTNAVPALLSALKDKNPMIRAHAASAVGQVQDQRLLESLPTMLKDPQPEVRYHAAALAANRWNSQLTEPFVGLLHDEYGDIRRAAVRGLAQNPKDAAKFIPTIQGMLKSQNPDIQASAILVLNSLGTPISRNDLLAMFAVPRMNVVSLAWDRLRDAKVTSDEAMPLLKNPVMIARLIGLGILRQNADKQAAELTLPLLKDREARVRTKAGNLLQELTGQNLPVDQPEQWETWWSANKSTFSPKPIRSTPRQPRQSIRLDTSSGELQPAPAPTPLYELPPRTKKK